MRPSGALALARLACATAVAVAVHAACLPGVRAQERATFVPDLARSVVLDPTTYAPAIVAWSATRLDWQSSQVFFENGWFEQNPRFTLSGHPGDLPISYGSGNHQILMDAIVNLRWPLINNVSERVVERWLVSKYPDHGTWFRVIGYIQRAAMASYLSYRLSADHFRQWATNGQQADRLGFE